MPVFTAIGTALGVTAATTAAGGMSAFSAGIMATTLAASLVGTGVSAYGSYQQGQAQKKQAEYQSEVANRQAQIAERTAATNVRITQDQAMRDTQMLQRKYALVYGAQKASAAAMGLGGGSKSMEDIGFDTFDTQTMDETNIRYNADIRSWAIKNQAAGEVWGLKSEANQYSYAGKNAAKAGMISGTGTIFSGVGNAGMNYMAYKKAGG